MENQQKLNTIIAGCKKGSREDFDRLINLYSKRLYNYFLKMTASSETSEELLSRLFLKLVENIKKYRGGSFDSWVFTIASNLFHDYLRKRYKEQRLLENKAEQIALETEQRDEKDMGDELADAMKRLDPDSAELISLRY